jgi:hypothetical protein
LFPAPPTTVHSTPRSASPMYAKDVPGGSTRSPTVRRGSPLVGLPAALLRAGPGAVPHSQLCLLSGDECSIGLVCRPSGLGCPGRDGRELTHSTVRLKELRIVRRTSSSASPRSSPSKPTAGSLVSMCRGDAPRRTVRRTLSACPRDRRAQSRASPPEPATKHDSGGWPASATSSSSVVLGVQCRGVCYLHDGPTRNAGAGRPRGRDR